MAAIIGLVVSLVVIASTCGGGSSTVALPSSDSTPPTVRLELYDIPLQQGAGSQDNPEVINATWCAIDRHIRSRANRIQVIGVGQDPEGIRSIRLTIDIDGTCEDPSTSLGHNFQKPTLHPDSAEPGTPTSGTSVSTSRSVAWTLVVDDQCVNPELATSVNAVVTATATNFFGSSVATPAAKLIYP